MRSAPARGGELVRIARSYAPRPWLAPSLAAGIRSLHHLRVTTPQRASISLKEYPIRGLSLSFAACRTTSGVSSAFLRGTSEEDDTGLGRELQRRGGILYRMTVQRSV